MPEFSYLAQTPDGTIERGRIRGANPTEVRAALTGRDCRLLGIEPARQGLTAPFGSSSLLRTLSVRALRTHDIVILLQQLAVMLESGLELTPSLRELGIHSSRKSVRQICEGLADTVERGDSLATAIHNTQAFPAVIVQLTRIGEETGELSTTLQRAAEFVERRQRVYSDIISAAAYPLLVAVAAFAVAVYLIGWAIPKLAVFLHAMGRKLPAMTQSLLDVSQLVQSHGPLVAVILASTVIGLAMVYSFEPGRRRIDQCVLHVPLFGHLFQMAETQLLASSLALMLRHGVFLPDALGTTATLHRNTHLAVQVRQAREELTRGRDLAAAFETHHFSQLLVSMMAVGERTGDLPKALEHVEKFYAAQLQSQIQRFSRLIEPAIIVFVGSVVGYVYIAFFMALLSAGGNFQ